MKTRGRPSKKSEKEEKEAKEKTSSSTQKVQLAPEAANPPQLFILPDNLHKDARIVHLKNPRHFSESPYVVCPERGFYELTRVGAPKTIPRSWLLSSDSTSIDEQDAEGLDEAVETNEKFSTKGYMLRNANMLMATRFDPLFFILPAISPIPTSKSSEPPKKLFLSVEDHFEKLESSSPQMSSVLKVDTARAFLEKRMASVCDTAEAGDEMMYRINEEKMLEELLKKARKMVKKGLPASMEEKFVRKALEVPALCIVREEAEDVKAESGTSTPPADTPDTQTTESSVESTATSFSRASTAATSFSEDSSSIVTGSKIAGPPPINAPEGVADLLRLRTAISFICSKYIAPQLSESIKNILSSSTSTVDFSSLETHLAHLAKLRQEILATRSLGDLSRKRSMMDDGEDGESRADKKRKKEEDEKKKKAGESLALKRLKKVNTTGMKKMSDFFKKK
ncbi:hypothetical protein G7Y89_g232 [Cudoniella acicularis]|uniref:Ribonuclease H2 subunit B n=1 Tax=Cudoniella acicularis TaxID=354080 RepID=A0A8H4WAL4_9HELO|nr:hypothetical protein G7Y89_g232 [Cudoniella acicularis]